MRLRPRRYRPQTTLALLVITFAVSVIVFAIGELSRLGWGRVVLSLISSAVFLWFAIGYLHHLGIL